MSVTEEIERLAVARASSAEIARSRSSEGMETLRQDGWAKVAGRTTLEVAESYRESSGIQSATWCSRSPRWTGDEPGRISTARRGAITGVHAATPIRSCRRDAPPGRLRRCRRTATASAAIPSGDAGRLPSRRGPTPAPPRVRATSARRATASCRPPVGRAPAAGAVPSTAPLPASMLATRGSPGRLACRHGCTRRRALSSDAVTAPPTCTSRAARRRWCASTARCVAVAGAARGTASRSSAILSILSRQQRETFEETSSSTSRTRSRRTRASASTSTSSATRSGRRSAHPDRDQAARGARPARSRSRSFATLPRGLVLVTGPTGSGKSTTLAAIIDLVNRTRADHIMTVEDPIEFLHTQQEVARQPARGRRRHPQLRAAPSSTCCARTPTSSSSARCATSRRSRSRSPRPRPATSCSRPCTRRTPPQTIDRIIDVFPPHQQDQIRVQLAATLQGVVCQTARAARDGTRPRGRDRGLVTTPAIANLIREGKTHQISSAHAGRAATSACTPWTSTSPTSSTTARSPREARPREGARRRGLRPARDPRVRLGHRLTVGDRHRLRRPQLGRQHALMRSPHSRTSPTRAATPRARSSRARSRRPARPPSSRELRTHGPLADHDHRVDGGHRSAARDHDPRLREGRRAQGPRDHEPPDGDHDRLGPVAAARALRSSREQTENKQLAEILQTGPSDVETGGVAVGCVREASRSTSRR